MSELRFSMNESLQLLKMDAQELALLKELYPILVNALQRRVSEASQIASQTDALALTAGQIGEASEDVAGSATTLAQMGLRA